MNFAKILVFAGLICSVASARAEPTPTVLLGHNLSPTTELPPEGTVSIGTYLLSYSPSDKLLVGTSSWMFWGYNSLSAIARYRLADRSSWFDSLNLQGAYIKSLEIFDKRYKQELAILWLTAGYDVSDDYHIYVTLNGMQFWNETLPISFRREPFNNHSAQISLSHLHHLKVSEHVGFTFELGALGLNYVYPHMIFGVGVHYRTKHFLTQLGFSFIARLPSRGNQSLSNANEVYDSSGKLRVNTAPYTYHPELQIQYSF